MEGLSVYDGYRLQAVYYAPKGVTKIAASTTVAGRALRRVVCTLWPDAKRSGDGWLVAGDHVAEIRVADFAYPRGGVHTLERAEIMVGAILDYRLNPAQHLQGRSSDAHTDRE